MENNNFYTKYKYQILIGFLYTLIIFVEAMILFSKLYSNFWIGFGFSSIFLFFGILFTSLWILYVKKRGL